MSDTPDSSPSSSERPRRPLLAWRPEYGLGIPGVDHEHQELFDLINELHDHLFESESATTVVDFLGELFSKISGHFALEEKMMRDGRYAGLRAHKADHERLLDEIRDLMDDYEDGVHVDLDRFALTLERWFSEHFSTHDAALHRWSAPPV